MTAVFAAAPEERRVSGRRISIGLAALPALAWLALAAVPTPAAAVVYCKAVGVPKGCVAAPAPAAAAVYCTRPGFPVGCVAKPAARAAVHCTRPGYPVGCVGGVGVGAVGAPGPGVSPVNRGGPVNRVGAR